ncbi:MAG TPA: M56 family metallopeptidase, partial [Bacteroidetes bacterium]|nr:M56 family metallopeptidase [Bacteroidota bacterium]
MKALESIIPQNLAEAVGTTFMHAIWQLAAVALLLLLVYQFVPRKSSRLRYNLGITALALMFILPLATFGLYFQAESQQVSIAPDTQTLLATGQYEQLTSILAAQDSQMAFLPGVTAFFSDNANLLFAIWALGAFLFTLRFLGSYLYVQRLRHRDTSPVPQAVMDSLLKLKEKLGIHRTIQLLQSAAVDTPMVIGVLRPVILLPIGLLSGLSPEQVQCILAHELAHIRRWDYLINIFQSIVEICLFFHPATWWVSKMVREERENCCDETVLALKNNNLVYAKALLNLEVLRTRKPNLAMTSNGGSLFKRIKRITGAEIRETRIYSKSLFVGLLTLTFILLLSTTGTDEIKASSPLSISGAPELAWELQPPSSATKSDKVTQPNTLLTPPSHPALPKVVTPDPQENPTPLFPVSTFLSHAKTIVQQAARNEVVAATATLGNISEEVGKEFSRDLLQFVAEQIAYAQDSPVSKIVLLENGEEIVIAIDVNGEVESVEVDGNPVAKSEYPKYKDMASGTVHNYLRANHRTPPPAPPAMPVPPMPNPGNIGSVPTPPHIMRNLPPTPQPPKPGTFPSPPSPPAKANMSDA